MQAHYITLLYPGFMFGEESKHPIKEWGFDRAHSMIMAQENKPYAFFFTTRERGPNDLESHESRRSPLYYLKGTVRTKDEILEGTSKDEEILRSNMRMNDYTGVVDNQGHAHPMHAGDIVLGW